LRFVQLAVSDESTDGLHQGGQASNDNAHHLLDNAPGKDWDGVVGRVGVIVTEAFDIHEPGDAAERGEQACCEDQDDTNLIPQGHLQCHDIRNRERNQCQIQGEDEACWDSKSAKNRPSQEKSCHRHTS
jgi:hypothetical protein